MAGMGEGERTPRTALPAGSEEPLSQAELADLFPRSVRPAVFAVLWALLVLLVAALVLLSLHYARTLG